MNSINFNGNNQKTKKLLLSLFLSGISVVKPKNILDKFINITNKTITINDSNNKIRYENFETFC